MPQHITTTRRTPTANEKLTIIIPAAGSASKLRYQCIKCLIPLKDGKTILERQIQQILAVYPNADIIVCTGFQADKVRNTIRRKYPVRFVYNPKYDETNVSYSIALALNAALNGSVLIIYSDLVFNGAAIANINHGGSSKLIISKDQFPTDNIGVDTDDNKTASSFSFLVEDKWAQIVYLKGLEYELLEKIAFNYDSSQNWFGYELLNHIIESGGTFITSSPSDMRIVEVDCSKDIDKANNII